MLDGMRMTDSEAKAIVTQAIALLGSHGSVPALDILDLSMSGRHGSDPDFSVAGVNDYDDFTDPNSPFGEILRRAFAGDELGPDTMSVWASGDESNARARDGIADAWQPLVLERFAARYVLWGS